jgi:serine phosphatase RsbU (regulator of sigma subunit)
VLRPAGGRLTLASAGHEAPLLVPADGGPIREVGRAGVLLGAWETIAEPEVELVLSPGDALVLYTDGVPDTRNLAGERFGDARLHAALDESRGVPADAIADHVRDCVATFRGAAEPADDLTLVVVRRKPRARRARGARAIVP